MKDKVDVLKLMDYMISQKGRLVGLHEARAAVAELIDAVAEFRRSAGPVNRMDVLSMDAALARVKGE